MRIPTSIEALIREPQTRAEQLRDADISIVVSLYTMPHTAATDQWRIVLQATRYGKGDEVGRDYVQCRDWDEAYEFLAQYSKPDRILQGEAEDEADEAREAQEVK